MVTNGIPTMNIEVQKFLNDSGANFSETSPRPPVPGEENELQSTGGTSTRSSGSHKSHLSAKSHTSSKSGRNEHSPAATPRRSNLDKTVKRIGFSLVGDRQDDEAPLGFEPEGSAANSPPFTENSSPSYLKWAESIHFLLEDGDGIRLFNQFLEQEQCSNLLSFYFACRGFKLIPPDDKTKAMNLAKLINRKYIKGEALQLLPDTKREITEKIKQGVVDQHLLDQAQQEVYNSMESDTYPLFLKSDLYVQYVQNGGESPKTTSNTSSGSNSVPVVGQLPTLQEGEELRSEDLDTTTESASSATLALTQASLRATRYSRSSMQKRPPEGVFLQPSKRKANPYMFHHISYAPTSAQDSELQSLSSDALTDDTISLPDSSVDGRDGSKKWSKHRKAVHGRARLNHGTEVNTHFIPRTERAPKGCNVAETDPKAFAAMLIERLEKVIKEREKMEKVKETMHSLDMTEEEEMKLADVSLAPTKGPNVSAIGHFGTLMANALAEKDEDNAQSILEDHVSRVWDNSAGQTPSRSPGRSPDRNAPHRRGGPPQLTGPSSNVSASAMLSRSLPHQSHHAHKRKDKDLHFSTSMLSFDSGVGGDDKSSAVHMDRHHHHYHHHHKRPQFMEVDTPRRPLQGYHVSDSSVRDSNTSWEDPNRSRSKDATKRLNAKKTSSDCNIDSGVSLYDASPVQVPNIHDPTNEKVLAWMLENEKVGPSNTQQYSTDNSDKSSSHKRSHKSAANSTSRSKKPQGQYHSSRSASLDRSYQGVMSTSLSTDYHGQHLSQVLPAQPFIQDPSMPLLNPPNPTTQLEEARRRLEDEKRRMMKSQSFTGATTKDRKNMPPPSYAPPRSLPIVGKSIPSINASMDLSGADESHSSSSSRSDRKSYSSKKVQSSSSAPTTPATSDVTVVGYYFCGEPIPYRSTVPGRTVSLAQFKSLITKKGNYKYFFKKASDEFDSGVILEEVTNDNDELPLWEGKVVGKVEKVE